MVAGWIYFQSVSPRASAKSQPGAIKTFFFFFEKVGKSSMIGLKLLCKQPMNAVDPSKSWPCIHPSHVTAGLRHQCISRKNPNTPFFQPRASGEDILCFVFLLKNHLDHACFYGEKTQYAVLKEFQHLWLGGGMPFFAGLIMQRFF